jgi:hypothetical protein
MVLESPRERLKEKLSILPRKKKVPISYVPCHGPPANKPGFVIDKFFSALSQIPTDRPFFLSLLGPGPRGINLRSA